MPSRTRGHGLLLGKSAAKLAGREPDGGLAASLPALPTRRTRFSTPIVRDSYALDPNGGQIELQVN